MAAPDLEEGQAAAAASMRSPQGGFVVHVQSRSQTRARRAAVVVSGVAAVLAVVAVAARSGAGRTGLQAISYGGYGGYGPVGAPGGYVGGPLGYAGGWYGSGTTYAAAPATAYASANYGVASGVGGPLGGGPTLPLASVVARNAERVAANSDALLRLYQHANAGLFATNQMLLHLQNEVQAAEGTWSTVPMEFPASYHAVPGVVAGASAGAVASVPYGPGYVGAAGGAVGTVTQTTTHVKSLKDAISAKAAADGAISAAKATASSPTAAMAAVTKVSAGASAAPPGFHLAWVPNAPAAVASTVAPTVAASAQVVSNAWNWRPLAQVALTAPAPKPVYTTESTYPYISGPYQQGAVNLFRPL